MGSFNWINNRVMEVVKSIGEYAEENEGEISDELLQELDQWEGARDGAIDEMAIQYKSLETKADMIKAQEKALSELRKEVEKDAISVKRSIGLVLNGEKFYSKNSAVSYRKSNSVHIYDENLLPEKYFVTKETVSISKAEIKKDMKSGDVDGATLESSMSVVIK